MPEKATDSRISAFKSETPYAVDSPEPRRLPFDVMTAMRTPYKIDSYQGTYFVIKSFAKLLEDTAPDFTPHYLELNSGADALKP